MERKPDINKLKAVIKKYAIPVSVMATAMNAVGENPEKLAAYLEKNAETLGLKLKEETIEK